MRIEPILDLLGTDLRSHFNELISEPLPLEFCELLSELAAQFSDATSVRGEGATSQRG